MKAALCASWPQWERRRGRLALLALSLRLRTCGPTLNHSAEIGGLDAVSLSGRKPLGVRTLAERKRTKKPSARVRVAQYRPRWPHLVQFGSCDAARDTPPFLTERSADPPDSVPRL